MTTGMQDTLLRLKQAVYTTSNPTDVQIQAALRDVLDFITSGKVIASLDLQQTAAPTDAAVQAKGVEVYDGMMVSIQSGSNIVLYKRIFGVWTKVNNT